MAGYWPSSFSIKNAKKKKIIIIITTSHLDRTSLVNKGFTIWLYLQDKTAKMKQKMKLFCSDRNSLQPAGVRLIYFQCIFGLACTHENLEILNYLKDLALQ